MTFFAETKGFFNKTLPIPLLFIFHSSCMRYFLYRTGGGIAGDQKIENPSYEFINIIYAFIVAIARNVFLSHANNNYS